MADFNQPTLNSLYSDFATQLKARDVDALLWLDGTTTTNIPSGAKRWNSTNSNWEKYNGSSWAPLATKYMIDVDTVDGKTVNDGGTSVNDLWTASKISTVVASKLDSASYTASDILSKLLTVDGAGSGLDADLLDGQTGSYFLDGTNFVWGVTDVSGKFYTGTTTPTGVSRLNYSGYLYPTGLNLIGAVETTSNTSHVFIETGSDGFVRPKTLANFKSEIFASPTFTGTATGTFSGTLTGTLTGNASGLTGLNASVTELNYVDGVTSNIQIQFNEKAPLYSPALTGTPTAPTAAAGTNSTQVATTAFVQSKIDSFTASSVTTVNITYSSNWVCPSDVYTIYAMIVGGGAGGGGTGTYYRSAGKSASIDYTNGGGGGAGGITFIKTRVSPGTSYTINIGAGGAGGVGSTSSATVGGTGGTTSAFGFSSTGGTGGAGGTGRGIARIAAGANGSTSSVIGSIYSLQLQLAGGYYYSPTGGGTGGTGGSGGRGISAWMTSASAAAGNGSVGVIYGGGGAGGNLVSGTKMYNGGAGASGAVFIAYGGIFI